MNKQRGFSQAEVLLGVLAIVLFLALGGLRQMVGNEVMDVHVNKSERVCDGGRDSCRYLIYTDNEVFENVDTFWRMKFDSSDLYGKIQSGNTYKIKVYGWRIPFFSSYRNITSVTPVQ